MLLRTHLIPFSVTLVSAAVLTHTPTVTIEDGALIGRATIAPGSSAKVNQFLGIPFADSPPERFALPQPPAQWLKPIMATAFKPSCIEDFTGTKKFMQFKKSIFDPGNNTESEDCLYLNVFTPAKKPPAGGWPVMFWIFGGNLEFGDAAISFYDGTSLAGNQEVVVVTSNYRTNVFGFPNSPEIPQNETNVGLYDQRQALTWVQNNIAHFGGDPKSVTIFGESAGGYSVKQLVSLPPEPLNFRAAIMESEGLVSLQPADPAFWEALVAALNCTTAPSALACVRTKRAFEIKNAMQKNGLSFSPINDEITATENVQAALAAPSSAKVPILLGTNSQEGRAFVATSLDNITSFAEELFPNNPLVQLAVEAAYPLTQAPYIIAADILTDFLGTCPTSLLAIDAAKAGYKVWRYYYNASFPNVHPFPESGAYHSSEIPEVFGTFQRTNATAQQIALSKYMQTAWANFAKNPSNGPGWTQFKLPAQTVGDLGGNGSFGEFDIPASSIDQKCTLFDPIIRASGQS